MDNKYQFSKLNQTVSKLITTFRDLFLHPICINACLHYSWGRVVHRNWGDDINIFLLKDLFHRNISYLYMSSLSMHYNKINYVMIGSTATMLSNSQSIIWGAGIIEEKKLTVKPKKILAVRGPLTRKYFINQGVECPSVFGDPSMLVKFVYTPNFNKKYKIGIIPHYNDYDHPALDKFRKDPSVLFIRMEGYSHWHKVIDQICSCEYIASSSLHGLIMAETYDIPNLWIELSNELMGGHFKFHDFFLSLNADRKAPYTISRTTSLNDILNTKSAYHKGHIDLQPLIDAAPFKIILKK